MNRTLCNTGPMRWLVVALAVLTLSACHVHGHAFGLVNHPGHGNHAHGGRPPGHR